MTARSAHFFDAAFGGDVISYQHIFWFYSHGRLHHDPARLRDHLRGHLGQVAKTDLRLPHDGAFLLAILLLGFTVWAHHMFVSGMFSWLRVPMMITTMLIAIPRHQSLQLAGDDVAGRARAIDADAVRARLRNDVHAGRHQRHHAGRAAGGHPHSDSYFVVAHIHYVLFGGSIFTVFAGVYYWFPKMTGRMYDERLGKIHFWLTFIGFNATFAPMHWIGLEGMPRRVADYADKFADWNLFVSIAAFMLGISTLFFFWNMIVSWKWGPRAPGNPWRAMTLSGRFPHLHRSSTSTRSGRRRPLRVRHPAPSTPL